LYFAALSKPPSARWLNRARGSRASG
jgi:hypothetical protein